MPKKKVVTASNIPDVIIAKEGYKALISINKHNYKITSKEAFELRPRFAEDVLKDSASLRASLDNGWVIPYTKDITLSKEPDLGFKIPILKAQNSFVTEVKFSVTKDAQDNPVITMGDTLPAVQGKPVKEGIKKSVTVKDKVANKRKNIDDVDVLKGEFVGEAPKFKLSGLAEAKAFAEQVAKERNSKSL